MIGRLTKAIMLLGIITMYAMATVLLLGVLGVGH